MINGQRTLHVDPGDDRAYLRFTVGTPEHTSVNACGERL